MSPRDLISDGRFWSFYVVMMLFFGSAGHAATPLDLASAGSTAGSSMTLAYEQSLSLAPKYASTVTVDIRVIKPAQENVLVSNFTSYGTPISPTKWRLWVSETDQLRDLCRGKTDPVLALEEILGMPPTPSTAADNWQIFTFLVPASDLFRPCLGGNKITEATCSLKPGKVSQSGIGAKDSLDPVTEAFLLNQLNPPATSAGAHYPFTDMGWTYDWDPNAKSPIGVTEFVIKLNSPLNHITGRSPAEFCQP